MYGVVRGRPVHVFDDHASAGSAEVVGCTTSDCCDLCGVHHACMHAVLCGTPLAAWLRSIGRSVISWRFFALPSTCTAATNKTLPAFLGRGVNLESTHAKSSLVNFVAREVQTFRTSRFTAAGWRSFRACWRDEPRIVSEGWPHCHPSATRNIRTSCLIYFCSYSATICSSCC